MKRDGIATLLTPEHLQRLRTLVLQSRYVVEGNLAGAHRSPLKGSSAEFADHRSYIQGDDPRHIDWKVFGRTDRYYIRRYETETNLRVYLVVDRSASMGYGSKDITKYRYACHLSAALGYVVVKVRDSVGLFLHSNKIDAQMATGNTFLHLNNLLSQLLAHEPAETTEIARTLHQVADSVHKRALIVILSDLFDDTERVLQALAHFRKQHHDVIVCHVLDPMELDFGFTKATQFEDMETKEVIAVDPPALAEAYRKVFGEFLETVRKGCAALNVDYRLARTDRDVDSFARAYLEERRRLSR